MSCALPCRRFTLTPKNFNWQCAEVSDTQLLNATTDPSFTIPAGASRLQGRRLTAMMFCQAWIGVGLQAFRCHSYT